MERLLECSKPEGSKVCDKVKPRIFDWEVIERYDGLVVDRNGAYPQMALYREGGDKKFIVIESILQQGLLITAHDETTVWTFIRCNGLFLYIKPTCRIQYTNGYFFEVYEYAKGIVVEKTTDFTCLFLFSMGVTKGKWGTLLNALFAFKEDYDNNAPLEKVLPKIYQADKKVYQNTGLKDLSQKMFAAMKELQTTQKLSAGFSVLPHAEMTPVEAYERLVKNEVEALTLDKMPGRTVATGVVPYPPGIPLLMPGENAGEADGPLLAYLKSLEAFDRLFPGFEHDTHGVVAEDGVYKILCLKK